MTDITAFPISTRKVDFQKIIDAETRVGNLETIGAAGAAFTSGGPVATATTANVTLSGEQTIDGVTTSADRVLVKDQTAPEDNGIYVTAAGAWARATDMDAASEVEATAVYVSGGTTQGGMSFATYSAVTTLGTDAIAFVQVSNNAGVQDQIDDLSTPVTAIRTSGGSSSGNILPITTDLSGRVVLGYDADKGELIGSIYSGHPDVLMHRPKAASYNGHLFYGQSLSCGTNSSIVPARSLSQPFSNVMPAGGARGYDGTAYDFSSLSPLVEADQVYLGGDTRGETPCSGAANFASLVLAREAGIDPSDHVILASSAGQGGAQLRVLMHPYEYPYSQTNVWYPNLIKHLDGLISLNSDTAWHCVSFLQGESDATGNGSSSDQATWLRYARDFWRHVQGDIVERSQQRSPVHLLLYQVSAQIQTNEGPALAQLQMAQEDERVFLTVPTYRFSYADGLHPTSVGFTLMGAYHGRAYARILQGYKPAWLNPRAATVNGAEVRVAFDVPVAPLVLDTANLPDTTDSGFQVLDGASAATILSISIDGDEAVITLSSAPAGAVTVRYGLDYTGIGFAATNGGSGNLRDSAPEIANIGGTDYQLFNPSAAFSLTALNTEI